MPSCSYHRANASLLILRCSCHRAHSSLLIPHCSYLFAHTSLLIPHCSYLMPQCSVLLNQCIWKKMFHGLSSVNLQRILVSYTAIQKYMPSCIHLSNASLPIPRCSCHRAHTSLLMPNSSLLIVDVSFLILPVYAVWLIPCASCLHIHTSLPQTTSGRPSFLVHAFLLVPHCAHLVTCASLLIHRNSYFIVDV